jgi:hypothetical protein
LVLISWSFSPSILNKRSKNIYRRLLKVGAIVKVVSVSRYNAPERNVHVEALDFAMVTRLSALPFLQQPIGKL